MPFSAGEVHAIEDNGGLVQPEGRYVVTVTAATEEVKRNNEVWVVEMKATTGDLIKDELTWSEKAMIRGKLACEAFGVDLESDPNAVIGAADLVGGRARSRSSSARGTRDATATARMFYGVAFRGYHALTAAQQQQAAQASVRQGNGRQGVRFFDVEGPVSTNVETKPWALRSAICDRCGERMPPETIGHNHYLPDPENAMAPSIVCGVVVEKKRERCPTK